MKRFLQYRVAPLLLACSMALSVAVIPAKAFDPITIATTVATVAKWWGVGKTSLEICKTVFDFINGKSSVDSESVWMANQYMANPANRCIVTKDFLDELAFTLVRDEVIDTEYIYPQVETCTVSDGTFWVISWRSAYDYTVKPVNKAYYQYGNQILCAPYDETGDDNAHENGKWVKYTTLPSQQIVSLEFLTRAAEFQRIQGYDCKIEKVSEGYVLSYSTGTAPYGVRYVYCSPSGNMFVSPADDRVVNGDREHLGGNVEIDQETGNITINGDENINVGIDIDGGTINLPDGAELQINQIIYDPTNKTYYVDGFDSLGTVYNYSFSYNIDYTSITYIGQTAEYNKYYEVYYELPDGRSSADLTVEELEQLNVSIDVIPYVRYSDDTSIRALYHFDGDTRDSSYWNYKTEFDWQLGASITYMDAGVFNGALYMDEAVDHKFTISLPSKLGSNDFTIQWRYYQSYTAKAATAPDGFLSIDGSYVFTWDGKKFFAGLGVTELGSTSTGQWMELALIRHNGKLYYYINGISIGCVSDTTSYGDSLTFGFGSFQNTYKYFDELRVLDFAYVEDGSAYSPSSVPHDSNLSLVLPDTVIPLADEYWSFNTDGNLISPYDFTALDSYSFVMDLNKKGNFVDVASWQTGFGPRDQRVNFTSEDGYTRLTGSSSDSYYKGALFIPLYSANSSELKSQFVPDHRFVYGDEYVFSLMLADGSLYSVPFVILDMTEESDGTLMQRTYLPDGSFISFQSAYYGDLYCSLFGIMLQIPNAQSLDVIYMELKQGSQPNTGHEYVTEVTAIDKDDLALPTLAVKTDLFITGYQIGGVRPSVPKKGLVWALVESGVIKSLQIYNGSAWEAVDGRIWTGSRWVPYSAFDVLLLKDLYDINGVVTPDDYEYIYTETGFWSWWQRSWLDFVSWIKGAGGTGSDNPSSDQKPDGSVIPPVDDDGEGEEWQFIDLLVLLKDGAWAVGKGIVVTVFDGISGLATAVDGVGGFFDSYSSGGGVFQIYEEGEGIWD